MSAPEPIGGIQPRLRPASEMSLNDLADLFQRTYTDYVIPVHIDADRLAWTICTQTIDLAASRIALLDETPIGFIFIASRGLSQRVAAMGVLPRYRDHGLGRWLLDEVADEARERGYSRLLLEVIDGNDSALTLYRRRGFTVTRPLVGYELDRGEADERLIGGELCRMDPRQVAKAVVHDGEPKLPWQRSADSFFTMQPPTTAWQLDRSAWAITSELPDKTLHLDALLVSRAKRRQGHGTRMLHALYAQHPDRAWKVMATVPEDLAPDFFLRNGFRLGNVRQFEMVLELR